MPRRNTGVTWLGVFLLTFVVNVNLRAQRSHSVGGIGASSHSSSLAPSRPSIPARPSIASRPAPAVLNRHQYPHRPNAGGAWRGGVGYQTRTPYLYPNRYVGYPWLFPFGYGLPFGDDYSPDDSVAQAPADFGNEPPPAAPPEMAAYDAPNFRVPYRPQPVEAPVPAQPVTTLVFNDGRRPLEVHNYALTGRTLFALDGETRQEIPLSELDLAATIDANRKTGVDFALPSSH